MNPLKVSWHEIDPPINKSLISILENDLNFPTLMPVQKAVVPLLCKNFDVAVESCTGSGKTLAFLVPVFQQLMQQSVVKNKKQSKSKTNELKVDSEINYENPKGVKCLIITPTRELALQIYGVTKAISDKLEKQSNLRIFSQFLIGGDSNLPGDANIIIGTPGRLREMLYEKSELTGKMDGCEFLILDEADRLIAGNHKYDVKDVLSKIPKQRRTGLFSATLNSASIDHLIKLGLRNPAKVRIKTNHNANSDMGHSLPERLTNSYIIFDNRLDKILHIYKNIPLQSHTHY